MAAGVQLSTGQTGPRGIGESGGHLGSSEQWEWAWPVPAMGCRGFAWCLLRALCGLLFLFCPEVLLSSTEGEMAHRWCWTCAKHWYKRLMESRRVV